MTLVPAAQPCRSCPYRRDVPSGVWAEEEYAKLAEYDTETYAQPQGLFFCHQRDGRLCSGWVGCHDMHENLAIRLAAAAGTLSSDDLGAVLDHQSAAVSLWPSGVAAAEHGRRDIAAPGDRARQVIAVLGRKSRRRPRRCGPATDQVRGVL